MIDPISMDEIPIDRLISFEQNGYVFNFDIETLARHVESGTQYTNPLNRSLLDGDIIAKIDKYIDDTSIDVMVVIFTNKYICSKLRMRTNTCIGDMVIKIYVSLDKCADIGKRNIGINNVSLHKLNLHNPISSLKIPINAYIASSLSYEKGDIGIRYHNLYTFAVSKHIEWLKESIHPIYRKDPPAILQADGIDEQLILHFLCNHMDKGIEYIDKGLRRLLVGARISVATANKAEGILNYPYEIDVDKQGLSQRYLDLMHLIYKHVVDTHNIQPGRGVGGYYHSSIYHTPQHL